MKYLITITSKNDQLSIPGDQLEEFQRNHPGSEVSVQTNNTTKITVLHNRSIELALSRKFDFLVLLHADVSLNLEHLASHIEECKDKYDVMGLCGCEKISVSESPLNWYCGSRKYPEWRWGCVCHGELGNSVSFFSADRPDMGDHDVACIDGLCMIFTRKAMESGLRFDENLGFNCYDTQISFDAVMNKKLRVGCLVQRDLKHFSVGRSILTDEFLEDEMVLRRRFGFEIPLGSRLEQLAASKKTEAV